MTTKTLKIDFVSDVSCPWCIIGLKALEQAADRLKGEVALDMHFQPFELNPQMGPEGQDINEHLQEKYGSTPEQLERNREAIAARGADLGFTFGKANAAASTTLLTRTACCTGPKRRACSRHSNMRCSKPISPMGKTRATTKCWCAWRVRSG
jgi:predicted DsbA family dithiol-disulfide isomerase